MYDITFFETELGWIEDEALRGLTRKCLEEAPAYFWSAPASSTGKHHPPDCNGVGGLCRHTAKVTWLVRKYADCFEWSPDRLVSAALLHDITKFGVADEMGSYEDYAEHAEVAAYRLKGTTQGWPGIAVRIEWAHVCLLVRTHMGRWGDWQPHNLEGRLLHIADVTASHKEFVALKFHDPDNYVPYVEEPKERVFLVPTEDGTDHVLKFGMYDGTPLNEVKVTYLQWILRSDPPFPDDVKAIVKACILNRWASRHPADDKGAKTNANS